jgi:hypothetical protein
MEQWRCVRTCFFRSRLWNEGDITDGTEDEIPRHFKSVTDGRVGIFGKKVKEEQQAEPKIVLEDIMKDSPLLEKAKYLNQMNKAELCAMGRSLGVEFNAEEMTRAEMIKIVIELKEKRGVTNQDISNALKR